MVPASDALATRALDVVMLPLSSPVAISVAWTQRQILTFGSLRRSKRYALQNETCCELQNCWSVNLDVGVGDGRHRMADPLADVVTHAVVLRARAGEERRRRVLV